MDLAVEQRDKFGKMLKILRQQGMIPAELYGRGIANVHLSIKRKDFERVFREAGESTVINLVLGNEGRPAIVYNIQRDYFTGEIIHIDFYQVRMDEKIRAHVLLEFIGEAPAVKEKGGILNKTLSEIEVEALPADLPHRLEVKLDGLAELNESIYAKDIQLPKGVKILVEPETVLVTVTPPLEEEKPAAPVEVSEVKVEAEEKTAERAKEKAAEQIKGKSGEQ